MKRKFQYWLIQILLFLSIIYVSSKVDFLFRPIGIFISTLFFPIIIAGFLFFLLNPVVQFLYRKGLPRAVAILIIYVAAVGIIVIIAGNLVPYISKQFTALAVALPEYANRTVQYFNQLAQTSEFKWVINSQQNLIQSLELKVTGLANTLPERITYSITNIIGVIANIAVILATVPFLLFYMLKDGHKFPLALSRFFPADLREEGLTILKETGETLSTYIHGQIAVALSVGTMAFIGYLIIHLPFALVMGLAIATTYFIPYIGLIIGAVPAIIVAFFDSPTKVLLVLAVLIVSQQIESNLLSPLILGKSLDIHPATIIIILLAAGNLAGVLGMILAVPSYAVGKTIVICIVKFLKVRKHANIP
ncbi:AI-2E family transporter [Neobacillus endophyticus]|uniref:AI-2E family transporter n=1 Tax=Neobacillus endophyticus TaxID=2738405 RepID=UPI001FE5B618|nr:AI-2E family transporter [Neobacillus endophyticus]